MTLHIGRVRHRTLALLVSLIPAALGAQTGTLVGYLVAHDTGEPLAYGVVGIAGLNRTTFTSDSGRFAFGELTPGQHLLHVRRLGFTQRDISFVVREGVTDTLRVELTRVAVRLSAVDVKAFPPCFKPGVPSAETDSALAAVVEQIKLNAEQYKFLAQQYPYWYLAVATRTGKLRRNGSLQREPGHVEHFTSSPVSEYKPGDVVHRRRGSWSLMPPTLVDVADSAFAAAHCWHYGGMETIDDEPVIRVGVVAFDSLKGPDFNGLFYVSARTFQLRRSVVHLSQRPKQMPELLDMEVTTEFFEVLPSIPIISGIRSVQTIDPQRRSQYSEIVEEHKVGRFTWANQSPEDAKKPPL
jgi:hypothetical protein